jgi:hypothetical protein
MATIVLSDSSSYRGISIRRVGAYFRFEGVDPGLQAFHRLNKVTDLSLKLGEGLCCVRCRECWPRLTGRAGGMGFKWISEEMGVASLAGTWLAGENRGEGTWGVGAGLIRRGPSGEALEGGLDRGEVVEGMETVGAAAKFSGGLWTAEHEEAEDGGLVAAQIEDGAGPVLVLGDASVPNWSDQGKIFQGVDGLANLFFG